MSELDQQVDRVLAEWNANPDNWMGDNVWSNSNYRLHWREAQHHAGYFGRFRFLHNGPHEPWRMVHNGTGNFATVKEAMRATAQAAIEHALGSAGSDDVDKCFWGPDHERLY